MVSNLPPGVTDSMIPGNSQEDLEIEAAWEFCSKQADEKGLTASDIVFVFETGVEKLLKGRKRNG